VIIPIIDSRSREREGERGRRVAMHVLDSLSQHPSELEERSACEPVFGKDASRGSDEIEES